MLDKLDDSARQRVCARVAEAIRRDDAFRRVFDLVRATIGAAAKEFFNVPDDADFEVGLDAAENFAFIALPISGLRLADVRAWACMFRDVWRDARGRLRRAASYATPLRNRELEARIAAFGLEIQNDSTEHATEKLGLRIGEDCAFQFSRYCDEVATLKPNASVAFIMFKKFYTDQFDIRAQWLMLLVPRAIDVDTFVDLLRGAKKTRLNDLARVAVLAGFNEPPESERDSTQIGIYLEGRIWGWRGEAMKKTREAATENFTGVPITVLPRLTSGSIASSHEESAPGPAISKLAAWLEEALSRKTISEGQLLKTFGISQNTLIKIRLGRSIRDVTRIKLAKAFDVANFEDIPSN